MTDRTERVDSAIRDTMDRVDETADRVRSSVSSRVTAFSRSFTPPARRSTGSFTTAGAVSAEAPEHA